MSCGNFGTDLILNNILGELRALNAGISRLTELFQEANPPAQCLPPDSPVIASGYFTESHRTVTPPLSRAESIAQMSEERDLKLGDKFIAEDQRPVADRLKEELAKIPAGMRYCDAPNFPKLKKIFEEMTPIYSNPSVNDPLGARWVGARWTEHGNLYCVSDDGTQHLRITCWPRYLWEEAGVDQPKTIDKGRPRC